MPENAIKSGVPARSFTPEGNPAMAKAAAQPETVRAGLPVRTVRTRPGPAIRQTSLLLGSVATAPRTARGVIKATLSTWGLGYLTDDAEAVTSELVTNAYTASREKAPEGTEPLPLTLCLTVEHGELRIRVWDPVSAPPVPTQPGPGELAEHGRGLFIVHSISTRWGWSPAPNGGKYVWAFLNTAVKPLTASPQPSTTAPSVQPSRPRSWEVEPCLT
jgi:anti-sigma regulatory factor (Ser/Thr protein kinase)